MKLYKFFASRSLAPVVLYRGLALRNANHDWTTWDFSSTIAIALNPGFRGVPKRRSVIWTRRRPGESNSGVIVQSGYWEKSKNTRKGSVWDTSRIIAISSG